MQLRAPTFAVELVRSAVALPDRATPRAAPLLTSAFVLACIGFLLLVEVARPQAPFPTCDDPRARAALTRLHDEGRLLSAYDATEFEFIGDDARARRCRATVEWSDGSSRSVPFEYDIVSSRTATWLSLWIDYNGGVRTGALAHSEE